LGTIILGCVLSVPFYVQVIPSLLLENIVQTALEHKQYMIINSK